MADPLGNRPPNIWIAALSKCFLAPVKTGDVEKTAQKRSQAEQDTPMTTEHDHA